MIETRAPGKLFIAGEYAVVDAGEPALLVAVDRYLSVRLTESAPAANETSPFEPPSEHVGEAVRVIEQLRAERGLPARVYAMEISSELEDEHGRKFGLGSSAAVTVAVIDALNRLYRLGLEPRDRFKLALLATIVLSPRASGGDVAACTFGGWLRYSSPDRAALAAERLAHGVDSALRSEAWAGFSVEPLPAPADLELLVGWTASPASTKRLVDGVAAAGDGENRSALPHEAFLARSRDCVTAIEQGLGENPAIVQRALRNARALLRELGESRGTLIETPLLTALCDIAEHHGAAAKPSGAGGGDCGIALAGAGSDIAGILREWEQRGIRQLTLAIAEAPQHAEGDAGER